MIKEYKKSKRRTTRNPGVFETYGCRIYDTDTDLRILVQMGEVYAYGDLIDYIGFLENEVEKLQKKMRLG